LRYHSPFERAAAGHHAAVKRPHANRLEEYKRRINAVPQSMCSATAAALLALGTIVSPSHAAVCTGSGITEPSRWEIRQAAGRPLLLTPCGEPFFSLGVNTVDGGAVSEALNARAYRWDRFAPSFSAWAKKTRRRLLEWRFNTAGAWSLAPRDIGLPSTPELDLGRTVQFVWQDPFDPALEPVLKRVAADAVTPFRGEPLRIGYFSDNEIGWWNGPLFTAYMSASPDNYTKRKLLSLVREHYQGSWAAFTRDFIPAPGRASFDDLLVSLVAPRLRAGGHGINVIRAWTRLFAARYYQTMHDALRAADPDALYLGDRLPIYYDPDAVRAMAPYVDAISVNYNVDVADGWIAPYFFNGLRDLSGGKPVLITEWFYAAAENRSGNRNRTGDPHTADAPLSNNRNLTGHLMTVATQRQRAEGAGRAARLLAAAPDVIGVHWFAYADEPPGGRPDGEDYNFGLVDVDDRPYEELVGSLQHSNLSVLRRVEGGYGLERNEHTATVLPRADSDGQGLVNWPKAASRLHLEAANSEVPFGDVHVAWNDKGLLLATIAMDYYDPELLGELDPFPRSEAFRIALGVDVGSGARGIELRVVPQAVEHYANKETRLKFSVEICRYEAGEACAAIPGAVAHYFGTALDQPRVILKALIPWREIGAQRPRVGEVLRLWVGVNAFYRSKWMSTDGVAPEVGISHPETWPGVTLGGSAPDWITDPSVGTAAAHPN